VRLRPSLQFRRLVLAVVLCNSIGPFVIVRVASACEGGGEELPANFVFSKNPVKFAGNGKLNVKVTNTGGFAAVTKFTIINEVSEGTKPKFQLYSHSGEAGVKNCSKSVNLAHNESCGLEVELVNFTGLEPNPPTAKIEMETSVADKFTDKLEK
jgi:hypothetical protein